MRFLVREELDFNKPINLRKLSPLMKIYAGFVVKWRETDFYKTSLNKRLEADYAAKVQRDEKLKEALLVVIFRELDNSKSVQSYGEESKEIVVQIKSKYIHSFDRIVEHKDFLPYQITKVSENSDLRTAFPEMPILVRIKKKQMNEEVLA